MKRSSRDDPSVLAAKIHKRLRAQVGQTIGQAIEGSGFTKTAFAKQLGVPESHINRLVVGRNLTLRTLAYYAAELNLEPKFYFTSLEKRRR